MLDYDFKTSPYDLQRETLNESWAAEFYALFFEMGLGKSKVTVDNMGALYEAGKIKAALILAPKGVYDNWASKEIPQHLPDRIERTVFRWDPKRTKTYETALYDFIVAREGGLKIFVMNIEALSTQRGVDVATAFLNQNPDNFVAVDESTTIKNRKAKRTKSLLYLRRLTKYRRILTGSPITKSPMDLFAQCAFLSPKALGHDSYYTFQNRYAIVEQRSMGARSFQQIVGYRRMDELTENLSRFSRRALKEDCLDLPKKIYMPPREVELTPEQKKLYTQMQKMALMQLEDGELVTTQSVLTQILRLHQICCGHVQSDDGEIKALPNNRMEALMSTVEETQGKAIIWATYISDIENIVKSLNKEYGPGSAQAFYGATPQEDRQNIVTRFQDPTDPLRFFVSNKTGAYGLTLTEARTVIYYSNSYDLEVRLQSEDRAHRIGQTRPVTYVDLMVKGTVDEKIIKALRNKMDIAGKVLGEEARDWLT